MNTLTQWPPRRAGCSGDCQQGRAPCDCLDQREGLHAIDTLLQRADCDPSLPMGQDEPSEPKRLGREVLDWLRCNGGAVVAAVILAATVCALLTVHFRASAKTEPARVPVVATRGMT